MGSIHRSQTQCSPGEDSDNNSKGYVGGQSFPGGEALLRSLFEHADLGVAQIDLSGNWLLVNQQLCNLLGYSRAELEQKPYLEMTNPADTEITRQRWQALIADEIAVSVLEKQYIHRTGKPVWVATTTSLVRDAQNQPQYFIKIVQDISDRRRTEAQLRQSQQRFARLVKQAPLAIIEWNTRMEVTAWNPAAEEMFGYGQAEALGQFMDFIIPPTAVDYVRGITAQLLLKQGGVYSVNENLTKQGQIIVCEWHNNPLISPEGEIVGAASYILDITARQQAETQLQEKTIALENTLLELQKTQAQMLQSEKMSGLGQMVAGVAHEINNPAGFVYSNLAHVEEYTQDLVHLLARYQQEYPDPPATLQAAIEEIELDYLIEDLPKVLQSMQVGMGRINDIVLSLRNFSRLDEAEIKPVDIHQGIDNTLMILNSRLQGQGGNRPGIHCPDINYPEIKVIREYGDLPLVSCYPSQLNQVFLNIISNAIDVLEEENQQRIPQETRADPGMIRIATAVNQTGVSVHIIDNGRGMDETVRSQIFNPFFTTKPVGKGTGLGLSICYQIVVEQHQGQLECLSAPGQGTEFIIRIPR
ncbi:MAG: PAS domain S-box protein [Oscillatoriales cyanobacterium SM2_3_0]|nr:PAS domain S-box protein [Oscillatoriales cyanobacterium SM2_3_0]